MLISRLDIQNIFGSSSEITTELVVIERSYLSKFENCIKMLDINGPTAASVAEFCSNIAAMTWNGVKKTLPHLKQEEETTPYRRPSLKN